MASAALVLVTCMGTVSGSPTRTREGSSASATMGVPASPTSRAKAIVPWVSRAMTTTPHVAGTSLKESGTLVVPAEATLTDSVLRS